MPGLPMVTSSGGGGGGTTDAAARVSIAQEIADRAAEITRLENAGATDAELAALKAEQDTARAALKTNLEAQVGDKVDQTAYDAMVAGNATDAELAATKAAIDLELADKPDGVVLRTWERNADFSITLTYSDDSNSIVPAPPMAPNMDITDPAKATIPSLPTVEQIRTLTVPMDYDFDLLTFYEGVGAEATNPTLKVGDTATGDAGRIEYVGGGEWVSLAGNVNSVPIRQGAGIQPGNINTWFDPSDEMVKIVTTKDANVYRRTVETVDPSDIKILGPAIYPSNEVLLNVLEPHRVYFRDFAVSNNGTVRLTRKDSTGAPVLVFDPTVDRPLIFSFVGDPDNEVSNLTVTDRFEFVLERSLGIYEFEYRQTEVGTWLIAARLLNPNLAVYGIKDFSAILGTTIPNADIVDVNRFKVTQIDEAYDPPVEVIWQLNPAEIAVGVDYSVDADWVVETAKTGINGGPIWAKSIPTTDTTTNIYDEGGAIIGQAVERIIRLADGSYVKEVTNTATGDIFDV